MKRIITIISIFTVVSSGILINFPSKSYAAQKTETVVVDKGTLSKSMKYSSELRYKFVSNSWIGKFPQTIEYNQGGYSGTLQGKTIILTPVDKVTDRKVTLTASWTDSTYRVRKSDVPEPSTVSKSYTDSASGTTITKSLQKSGNLISVGSKSVKVYSASYGRGEKYDPENNSTLGYMSNNTRTYYGGLYSFSSKPRKPNDYYGPDASTFGSTGWTLVDIAWDECCVRDAEDSRWHYKTAQFGYRWRSDKGNLNRYRKGVYLNYYKYVTGHKYKQNYSGTYKLPDIATKWKIQVVYEGTVKDVNLTAQSIRILDLNNQPVSHLIKGNRYKAEIVYRNTGETITDTHKIYLYDNGTYINYVSVGKLWPGDTRTTHIEFTANNAGNRTFEFLVDGDARIKETNESDNTSSTSITVLDVNLTAQSIRILDLNNQPVSHLIKGNRYKAEIVYRNTSETIADTHKIYLYDNGTYINYVSVGKLWPGDTRTTHIEFTANNAGNRTFESLVDGDARIKETNESDNTSSTSILVNTPPNITMQYTPSDVWEGDNVRVCLYPTDADNHKMDITLKLKINSRGYTTVYSKLDVSSNTENCTTINNVQDENTYTITATVTDGYDSSSVTNNFKPKPLSITGRVLHTDEWLQKHKLLGTNWTTEFFSGEKFLLETDVSPYPTQYVKVTFNGSQVNGDVYNRTIFFPNNPNNSVLRKSELYEEAFLQGGTQLSNGPKTFEFEVQYTNGVIKRDTVTIQIIGNIYDVFRLHQRF